jgi:FtsH-binding integral membrane protein
MVSWVAQESDGLLDVDAPAVWLIALIGVSLTALAAYFASQKPWRAGSMKLAPSFAKIMFVTMIALTAMWIFVAIAHTRTPTAQVLYSLCAWLSGWSAWAIFVTLRDFEATKPSA